MSLVPVDGEDVTKGLVRYVTIGVGAKALETFGKKIGDRACIYSTSYICMYSIPLR